MENDWFKKADDFATAISDVEAVSTGIMYIDRYVENFRSRAVYYPSVAVKSLFDEYVKIKRLLRDKTEAIERLVKFHNEDKKD